MNSDWNTDPRTTFLVEQARSEHRRDRRLIAELRVQLEQAKTELQAAVAERESLLTEWMHSTEAFRRLARLYGKALNLSDEQRTEDLRQQILLVAEEDTKFAKTKLYGEVNIRDSVNG